MRNRLREWFLYRTGPQDDYGPIHLASISPDQGKQFFPFVKNALRLIETYDPRGYHHMVRQVRYIADSYTMYGGGTWGHNERVITVNFTGYRVASWFHPDYDFAIAQLACTLIHEMTHGRVSSRGIRYRGNDRIRIERLCFQEEQRFAARLQAQGYATEYPLESLAPPFEETVYTEIWNRSFRQEWARRYELWLAALKDIRTGFSDKAEKEEGSPPRQ